MPVQARCRPTTRGWRRSAHSHAQCRLTASTTTITASDQITRCDRISSGVTAFSSLKYSGNRPHIV